MLQMTGMCNSDRERGAEILEWSLSLEMQYFTQQVDGTGLTMR